MKPEQRAVRGAAVAASRGTKAPPAIEKIVEEVETQAKAEDLDNPETQRKIEFPPEIPHTLVFRDGTKRGIIVKSEFSLADVHERNILEDIESFRELVIGEIGEYSADAGESLLQLGKTHLVKAALTSSLVRNRTRRIVAKISRYVEPWKTKDAKGDDAYHTRPTVEELAEGLSRDDHYALATTLMGFYMREVERSKKDRAAAQA